MKWVIPEPLVACFHHLEERGIFRVRFKKLREQVMPPTPDWQLSCLRGVNAGWSRRNSWFELTLSVVEERISFPELEVLSPLECGFAPRRLADVDWKVVGESIVDCFVMHD
jgi:hypothetical protein